MITAFQIGAFQFTGFQEAAALGSGGHRWLWLSDYQQRRRARERRKLEEERKKREDEELAILKPQITRISYVARATPAPVERVALASMLKVRQINRDAELEDFRELMQMVADMEEV